MATTDPLKLAIARNTFYRRRYLIALGVFFLFLTVIAILSGMLIYIYTTPTKPVYFATDPVGRLEDVIPIDRPNMDDDQVKEWAIDAVQHAYSYDFVNYRAQLQWTQKYFSTFGWEKFMSALTGSNNLEAITKRKLVVVARVVDEPIVKVKGIVGTGSYAWKLEMPLLVTYWMPPYDEKSNFSNSLKISVIIQREPILQSYKGLGILQIVGSAA